MLHIYLKKTNTLFSPSQNKWALLSIKHEAKGGGGRKAVSTIARLHQAQRMINRQNWNTWWCFTEQSCLLGDSKGSGRRRYKFIVAESLDPRIGETWVQIPVTSLTNMTSIHDLKLSSQEFVSSSVKQREKHHLLWKAELLLCTFCNTRFS